MVNFTHCAEFFERDLAVAVAVGEDDGLVDDLLELAVLQVVAHHHLEHGEELAVADVAVLVHVVDLEGDCTRDDGRCNTQITASQRATMHARCNSTQCMKVTNKDNFPYVASKQA